MASFEGDENGDHRSHQTYNSESAVKEAMASVLKMYNVSDEVTKMILDSSYIAEVGSLLKMDVQSINNPSTVEELPILNAIEDSTINKGDTEEMQIECQSQSPIKNEGEINIEDKFYSDQAQSTSCQDLCASNVCTNYAIPSTSKDAQIQQRPANEADKNSLSYSASGYISCSTQNLNRHRADKHGTGKYKCDDCKRVFDIPTDLNKHIISCPNKGRYTCCICEKKFYHMNDLLEHKIILLHCSSGCFVRCNICRKNLDTQAQLNSQRF